MFLHVVLYVYEGPLDLLLENMTNDNLLHNLLVTNKTFIMFILVACQAKSYFKI